MFKILRPSAVSVELFSCEVVAVGGEILVLKEGQSTSIRSPERDFPLFIDEAVLLLAPKSGHSFALNPGLGIENCLGHLDGERYENVALSVKGVLSVFDGSVYAFSPGLMIQYQGRVDAGHKNEITDNLWENYDPFAGIINCGSHESPITYSVHRPKNSGLRIVNTMKPSLIQAVEELFPS